MQRPPLVSIVTPSYNQARFLRATIESVLSQTYPHIDYVVIDGGSTDNSRSILQDFTNEVRWVSERDRGQTHAINKGLARTQGELCAYLNSDDVLAPMAVERVVGYFEKYTEVDVVYGRAEYIDELGKRIGFYPTQPFSLARLAHDSCLCQPAVFWRSSIAERVGPFNESLNYCMDYEYWLRIANAGGKFLYVDDVLASARLHSAAKTTAQSIPMHLESIEVCYQQLGSVTVGPFLGLWKERIASHPGIPQSSWVIGLMARLHLAYWIAKRARKTGLCGKPRSNK
ncbi:MAG: glycosyltransferase family 2 protein [Gemmataceae bacterium]